MESPETDAAPDPPDWELLDALFGAGGDYRHRMGLRRADAGEFYAATFSASAIRREKETVLRQNPALYTLTTEKGEAAATEFVQSLSHRGILPAGEAGCRDDVRRLSLALEPDLLLVAPPDWTLVWASVCFPSRWSLEGKGGRPLGWIHDAVPGLNAELGSKIATFFARLPPGEGWRRANWGLSASARRNQHPSEPIPPLVVSTPPEQVFLRVEDQHLLKLPRSGVIAFGIRIVSFRWSELMQNGKLGPSIQQKLRSISPEVARYKGIETLIPSKT